MFISKRYILTTGGIAILAILAAGGGLFVSGLYRDPSALVQVLRGQDLITLLVAPLLMWTAWRAYHGSTRSLLVYLGLLGYILYTYTGAAFAYHFNELIVVYIALFSLSLFTLVGVLAEQDVEQIRAQFDKDTPRKPVIAFMLMIVVALGFSEVMQIIPFYTTGELPMAMQQIESTTYFVYVLDLGVIVPLCVLATVWLWRDHAWGYVLSICMLIKAATMGLALISMNGFAIRAGQETDGLVIVWVVIAAGGLGLSFWMLKHCDRQLKAKLTNTLKQKDKNYLQTAEV